MRNAFSVFLLVLSATTAFSQISTFDNGNDGWTCDGDPVSTIAEWHPSGGNPGGYAGMTDASTGGTWYFVAPAKFRGSKCDAYGKFLRYDQFADDHSNPNTFADVELIGGGIRLVFDHPILPNPTWTHYDLFLREDAGWKINTTNGLTPTQAQFKQVLSNITSLRIRGEFHHVADDYGGIDNVRLESNFNFDLDGDDSSGPVNGDFRADTSCYAYGAVVDIDVLLTSEGPVDSITITIPGATTFEQLHIDAFPPNIDVIVYAPDRVTLVNLGGAGMEDFLSGLKLLTYFDHAPDPERSVRTIEFKVYAGCGLADVQHAYLPVFPPPVAGESGDTTVCITDPPFNLFLLLGEFADPGGYWLPAPSIAPGVFDPANDKPGRYTYIIPPSGECEGDTAEVLVRVERPPSLRPDTLLCYEDAPLRIERPRELLDWTWGDGSHFSKINVTEPGIYTLSGATEFCVFADSVRVDFFSCLECAIYIPNVFSPNDDGENDGWHAFLPCRWLRFRIQVYDRWGSLVFEADDPETAWDGYVRGQEALTGVYAWQLEWDAELFGTVRTWYGVGDVTVVR